MVRMRNIFQCILLNVYFPTQPNTPCRRVRVIFWERVIGGTGGEVPGKFWHFWLVFKVKKLRGSRGGTSAKKFRFCKVLSIVFIVETKAKKGGPGSCQMFAELIGCSDVSKLDILSRKRISHLFQTRFFDSRTEMCVSKTKISHLFQTAICFWAMIETFGLLHKVSPRRFWLSITTFI